MIAEIAARYQSVIERAAEAAHRSGRRPEDVTVIAAGKGRCAADLRHATAAGARDFGENYVQEARAKVAALGGADVCWHFIGRLQRNKASEAARLFRAVHSLDGLELAAALDRGAAREARTLTCLVEVNLGGEKAKGGVAPDALPKFLEEVAELPHLAIRGLMAIPPWASREESRRSFAMLRELRDRLDGLRLPNVELKELSMGMSSDFEMAIAEGATMVRIGTAIFGPRG